MLAAGIAVLITGVLSALVRQAPTMQEEVKVFAKVAFATSVVVLTLAVLIHFGVPLAR